LKSSFGKCRRAFPTTEGESYVRELAWLLDFRKDVYSQTGEDGVIQKILQILSERNKWCVEFGAWDGVLFSNTRNLIENADYSAILIEGSKVKWDKLKKNYSSKTNIISINTFVGFSKDDNLDVIPANTPVPFDFDFLSIDVDGNDYHICRTISKYRPKVICYGSKICPTCRPTPKSRC